MSDRESVSAAVPDSPSDAGSVAAPEAPRRRDTSGLNRGTEENEKRARDRVRLALRRARRELAELPPEMRRLLLVQEDIRRKAFLSVVFDEAKRRVLRQSPVTRAGEIRESVKVMFDAADRLHGWTESLLKLWPHAEPTEPIEHRVVFTYEDPEEGAPAATAPALDSGAKVETQDPTAGHRQATEGARPELPPLPPPTRRAPTVRHEDPRDEDMSGRLGWTTVAGDGDDDE